MASNLLQIDNPNNNQHNLYYLDWNLQLYSYSVQDTKDMLKFLGTKPIIFEIPSGVNLSMNTTMNSTTEKITYKLIKLLQWKENYILCVLDDMVYLIQGDKGEFIGQIQFLKDLVILDEMLIVAKGNKGAEMLELSIK